MKAMYGGVCAICDKPWSPGELIVRRKEQYVHAACAGGGDDG